MPSLISPSPLTSSYESRPGPASLSRNIHADSPVLVHSLLRPHSSTLSLAVDGKTIFSGNQAQDICVRLAAVLRITIAEHRFAVLGLVRRNIHFEEYTQGSYGQCAGSRVRTRQTVAL